MLFHAGFRLIVFLTISFTSIDAIKLIPEGIANILKKSGFMVSPDMDSHDYIYSVKDLRDMHNWPGHQSSKCIEKFLKLHPDYLVKSYSLKEIRKGKIRV